MNAVGEYIAELHGAVARAWKIALLLLPTWVILPYVIQSLAHPLDVVKLDHIIHGLAMPHTAGPSQLAVAFVETAMLLGGICLWQLVVTVAFYRKAKVRSLKKVVTPRLWPVVALVGALGNLVWFIGLGGSGGLGGYIVGLAPTAITIAIEMLCERLGRDFVVGPPTTGFHPPV